MFTGIEMAGLGALGMLAVTQTVTHVCRLLRPAAHELAGAARFAPCRVPDAPAPVRASDRDGARVEFGIEAGPDRGPVADPVREPHRGAAYRPMIFASPREQMIEFLRATFAEHDSVKLPAFEWASYYREWATARRIALMPDREFLTLLGRAEGARKSRDRVKDRMGRVVRNEHGTPLRVTYYALARPEAAARRARHGTERTARGERLRAAA